MDKLVDILNNKNRENSILSFIGINGVIDLYDNKLVITRDETKFSSLIAHGIKGNKTIPLSSISAVQIKTKINSKKIRDNTVDGYIQFTILGGVESKLGLIDALMDENTVTFASDMTSEFENLKDLIISKQSNNLNSASDITQNLIAIEKLAELKEKNYITEEEFIAKKKQFLNLD